MPINLSKGQKVSLTKENPGLKKIMVGLGWDVNAFDSGADFDLDASAFLTGANGKCLTDQEFIFYGNLEHQSGAVVHLGDNRTGAGEGDDEQIEVDLSLVPANIERIAFTVTIYDADKRRIPIVELWMRRPARRSFTLISEKISRSRQHW